MLSIGILDVAPATLSDADLTATLKSLGTLRHRVDAVTSAVAAEIAHRSRRDDGYSGLAQREGAGTPEKLVQKLTGLPRGEAETLVRAGVLQTVDAAPWLSRVGPAVATGELSVAQADVLARGLGTATAEVAADDLADAANRLLERASELTVEQLAREARAARDDLDVAGVQDRERALRAKRYLTLKPLPDGMTQIHGLLDPESAAIVGSVFDAATSPRRGGPRFVDADDAAAAKRLVEDDRTVGQIALDAFVDLLRVGSEVDPDRVLGARRHAVQVLVTAADLNAPDGTGVGFFRDRDGTLSTDSVKRHVCDTGTQTIYFDTSGLEPLQVGRSQRLFTTRQRHALAARDGGCRFPDCDRPVSWTEAHHTTPWNHGGRTDTSVGILLCRHHHLLIHDNRWHITPDPTHGFVAIPPRSRDPEQTPLPMPPRSRAAQRLRHIGSSRQHPPL